MKGKNEYKNILIIIIIIYKYYGKRLSVNGHTQLARLGWIKIFSCRYILFYVLYVTFSLFVII